MSNRYLLPAGLCVLVIAIGLTSHGQASNPPAPEWQYKVVHLSPPPDASGYKGYEAYFTTQLNQLGMAGWEVVSSTHEEQGSGLWYTLKRRY